MILEVYTLDVFVKLFSLQRELFQLSKTFLKSVGYNGKTIKFFR